MHWIRNHSSSFIQIWPLLIIPGAITGVAALLDVTSVTAGVVAGVPTSAACASAVRAPTSGVGGSGEATRTGRAVRVAAAVFVTFFLCGP